MLADEERKHYDTVAEMHKGSSPEPAETTILSDAADVFKNMRQGTREFNLNVTQKQLYQKAQQIEKNSKDFYLDKANQLTDSRQKEIFKKLADEEEKHYFLLENIIDFISEPETYLENAEFFHLEQY